jgi:hypothetical protein
VDAHPELRSQNSDYRMKKHLLSHLFSCPRN